MTVRLSAEQLRAALDILAASEPCFAAAIDRTGYPPPRIRERGYATLLRTIIGQQVSNGKAADRSAGASSRGSSAGLNDPAQHHPRQRRALREAGLSRQKASARSLADEVPAGGSIDNLPADDERR